MFFQQTYNEISVEKSEEQMIMDYEDIYYYYLDAQAISTSEVPKSKSIYYMYTLDLDIRLQNMLRQYDFERRGEEVRVSDQAKTILEEETMTLNELEVTLARLGLFFYDQEGNLVNEPYRSIW